ncbi:MBL fold metallo-hydrolase [Pseudomonas sp. RIT-PI-AD]|uniref:MBL fold metallo-hydrolase n=1 Tax=Pseudomonas sp. RIT-PI-AD TaxID=3035294 RepID=UPI0021DB5790|nr:MBL fold metallo-hydrolase [Pseudomonas sp. RIT-PI-AD]
MSANEPAGQPSPLRYPFPAPPARGRLLEVGPGVFWIRMPLPYALDHINLWALADGPGWTLVDTGLHVPLTLEVWAELFAHWPDARPITRVIATHMHADHVGLAGWFAEHHGCRLWMSRLDYLNSRLTVAEAGDPPSAVARAFYRRCGWGDEALDAYPRGRSRYASQFYRLPESYRRLQDGEELAIGAQRWRVIVGTGHSPEHVCLYCAELALFISGDQVLPRITSNVSTYASEPEADPLADWYASLAKLRLAVPDEVLVLPSHNVCFYGLHARLEQLRDSADEALASLRRRLRQPARVIDTFAALFARPIPESDPSLLRMATGEALSHLNWLLRRGEIHCHLDEHGIAWYRLAPEAGERPAAAFPDVTV